MSKNHYCYFCREGKDFTIAKQRLGDSWPFDNEVVYHDDNLFVIVGSSPQVIPYLLILPYRHIFSAAEMSKSEKRSLLTCLDYLVGNGGYSSELCIFEHGGKSKAGSSSIDHCHIHVIDGLYGLFDQVKFDSFEVFNGSIPAISGSYLLVGKYCKNELLLKIQTNHIVHERQYFRRRLSEILGEPQWDWRIDPKIDRMEQIMRGFSCGV